MELLLNIVANLLGAVAIALSTWAYIKMNLESFYFQIFKIDFEYMIYN